MENWAFPVRPQHARALARGRKTHICVGLKQTAGSLLAVGDELWVQEDFIILTNTADTAQTEFYYRADLSSALPPMPGTRWTPKTYFAEYMSRRQSRFVLTIEDLKRFPLQSLALDDLRCEGIAFLGHSSVSTWLDIHYAHLSPRQNPDVIGIRFRAERRNIDGLALRPPRTAS